MTNLVKLNSTLREGTQHTNVQFDLPAMIEVTEQLLETGNADLVEVHCYPGETTRAATEMLKRFGDKIVTHHRAYSGDIQNRIAVAGHGNTAMFQSVSIEGLQSLGMTVSELRGKIVADIKEARSGGVTVAKYTLEHATDTDPELLKELCLIAQETGAKRIGIPDTRGIFTLKDGESEYGKLFEYLMSHVDVPLATHCHNDLGFAVANSLAAYDAAVRMNAGIVLDSSILGIGERAGETPTEVINIILRVKRGLPIQTEDLYPLAKLVSGFTGVYPGPHDPIVGDYAFTHRAGTHVHKIKNMNPNGDHPYLPFPSAFVGREEGFNLSSLAGNSTIIAMLDRYGVSNVEAEKIETITGRVKKLAEETGTDVISRDFEYIASEVIGIPLDSLVRKRGTPETSIYHIFVKTSGSTQQVAMDIRRTIRAARYIGELFGEQDILVTVPGVSSELGNAYVDMIRKMPSVASTTTYISARTWK